MRRSIRVAALVAALSLASGLHAQNRCPNYGRWYSTEFGLVCGGWSATPSCIWYDDCRRTT
ncbi:MAG TPA: hypothetical protein VFQ45_14825 [Longimicrobium sp.]|nr:hypothetical protein [Longimicrobium sp.]